jgi:murein DD-endopeptidase MepM/ murein hydrolase activator NlpD
LGLFVTAVAAAVVGIVVGAPQTADPRAIGAVPSLATSPTPWPEELFAALGVGPGDDTAAAGGASEPASTVDGAGAGSGEAAGGRGGDLAGSKPPQKLKGYRWPLSQGRITSYFDFRDRGFLMVGGRRIHEGIDIASFCGAAVRAAHSGRVLAAGRDFVRFMGFSGSVDPFYRRLRRRDDLSRLPIAVVVDDGNGYRSVYIHLGTTTVERGQRVRAGQVLGTEGATGNATGCHLHYELIRMDGRWMRVAPDRVREDRYPPRARERVDPLRVLSLDDPEAPRQVPGVEPPRRPPRVSDPEGPDG